MPVPYIVALAMASSMAMTPAGCPSPFWPSTRPVARSSRATVGSAHGWMYPRRHHSTYFGSMPIPCESTPRRSVLTMSRAVTSAAVRGIFIAMRTPTMKSCRCVWVTTTGASVMVVPVPSEAGDLEAGVLELVAAVDRGEERGDAFERPGVGERADVDRAEPDRASELAHGLLGGGGGAAEQQIALDRLVGFRELVGGDVVEGGDDVRLGQERLDLLGRGARRRRRVETRATEGERHHGADDDLAPAAVADLGERRREAGGRERDDDHFAELRGLRVRLAHDGHLAGTLPELGGLRPGALGIPRADDDRVASQRAARAEPGPLLASAAEDRDVHWSVDRGAAVGVRSRRAFDARGEPE